MVPFLSTIVIVFILALCGLGYYFYYYRLEGINDKKVIFKHEDEFMDLYEQYWAVTKNMEKILKSENNSMSLDDLLHYLRDIKTGRTKVPI